MVVVSWLGGAGAVGCANSGGDCGEAGRCYIAIVALVSVRQAGLVVLLACSWCW